MILGQTITLYEKAQSGENSFNEPIYTETKVTVDNVLIAPVSGDDIIDTHDLDGKKEVYTLAIPKGDTHDWDNQNIEFWGKKWRSFGAATEGMEENIPLAWNKKVMVERIE